MENNQRTNISHNYISKPNDTSRIQSTSRNSNLLTHSIFLLYFLQDDNISAIGNAVIKQMINMLKSIRMNSIKYTLNGYKPEVLTPLPRNQIC